MRAASRITRGKHDTPAATSIPVQRTTRCVHITAAISCNGHKHEHILPPLAADADDPRATHLAIMGVSAQIA
ncbi:MAG: hypothetical protein ABW110_05525, partial [Steroidobacteraceae bacterium]